MDHVIDFEKHLCAFEMCIRDSGETLDSYKKDGSDIEYISDGYFHESEFASAPAFDILIDGIKTIDN